MTVAELKKELDKYDDNTEIVAIDIAHDELIELQYTEETHHHDMFHNVDGLALVGNDYDYDKK